MLPGNEVFHKIRLQNISVLIYLLDFIQISRFFFKDIDLRMSNLTKRNYISISLFLWNIWEHWIHYLNRKYDNLHSKLAFLTSEIMEFPTQTYES